MRKHISRTWEVGSVFKNFSKNPVVLDAVAGKNLADPGGPGYITGDLTRPSGILLLMVLGILLGGVN